MAISFSLLAQEEQVEADTAFVSVDSLILDVITPIYRAVSSNAIDKQVTYSAAGQVRRDIVNQRVILTNQAIVRYGDIEIQADSMVFNMANNLLYAIGLKDTTGKVTGSPVFKEKSNEFKCDELSYNFKTKQAHIKNITTKQDEGIIHSAYTKLLEDGTSNIGQSSYSTCDADPPHFYINMPKARVYPGEKIVSGPGNLVVEGIPLPLIIPFGYFPINTRSSSSGIQFPTYGQEHERGYTLRNMGYYFSINDYIDLNLTGDIYTNGTWGVNVESRYKKLYKYDGSVKFNYVKNVKGHKGLADYSEQTNYNLGWTFNQDTKASPGSRFSANVSMSSGNYHQQNSYDIVDRTPITRTSSISYTKSWAGTPFNLATSMNYSQNTKTKTIDYLNLPKATFTMNRIYPLKGKSIGKTKWYQDLQFQYSASLDNQVKNIPDSLLFTNEVFDNMKNGFNHKAPLSLNLKPFKNFSVTPSMTYDGYLYTQKIEKTWDEVSQKVVKDTINGVFYGHSMTTSFSASYNPQIFGTFAFINPDARVQAIRHIIRPTVGFNFTPALNGLNSMLKTVQADSAGTKYEEYSMFEGSFYGPHSLTSKKHNGTLSFGLSNLLEAKVFSKNDTTGIPKKIKLIDNLGMNASYNIFKDSMRWSDISMTGRTILMEKINIDARSNFSIYALDSTGREINQLFYNTNNKLLRFKRLSITTGLDFSLDQLIKKISGQSQTDANTTLNSSRIGFDDDDEHDHHISNEKPGYQYFDMPWTFNVRYSLTYEKAAQQKSNIRQTLSMNGNVSFTKNMSATVYSGYDFDNKQITMTQIGVQRDLHCWTMDFSWSPIGHFKFWNFTIRAKASVLRDLKYDRKKSPYDTF